MTSSAELTEFSDQAADRRWWLLCKALETAPLDRAIELARAADAFVTGSADVLQVQVPDAAISSEPAQVVRSAEHRTESQARAPAPAEPIPKRPSLALSPEQREQLLQRLAQGAKNADLAQEFGISARQVQGIRMGSAREIEMRRNQPSTNEPRSSESFQLVSSADEIVRYLRQQDDVVVPQADGEFMINGRFSLDVAELVSRANRMRARQGKPEFKLVNDQAPRTANLASANGHPIFWKRRSLPQSNGKTASSG